MPYYNRDPKRAHNFDNHPYGIKGSRSRVCTSGFRVLGLGLGVLGWCTNLESLLGNTENTLGLYQVLPGAERHNQPDPGMSFNMGVSTSRGL